MKLKSKDTSPKAVACRILLVDDQERVAQSIARVLRGRGHEVRVALDGPSALEQALAFEPDLALVDISLPGMDGFELAARLRAEPALSALTLVALSGYDPAEIRERVRDAGFDHHLVKPPSLDSMDALIGSAARAALPKPR